MPLLSGVLGSLVTTWVTFAPCFLFIFAGAPYVEYLRGVRVLGSALRGISAAVLGVILNLAVWFATHTLFASTTRVTRGPLDVVVPGWASMDLAAALIAFAAILALFRFGASMFQVLAAAAVAGVAISVF